MFSRFSDRMRTAIITGIFMIIVAIIGGTCAILSTWFKEPLKIGGNPDTKATWASVVPNPDSSCTELLSEGAIPSGSSADIMVDAGTFQIWTSGSISISSQGSTQISLSGGANRGNVVVMLSGGDSIRYSLHNLTPHQNWRGIYKDCGSQDIQGWIDLKVSQMKDPPNCVGANGCQIVEVLILRGNEVLNRYTSRKSSS